MGLGRKENTLKNVFWGLFSKLISTILPFILRTIIIKILGTEYLGLSSLFMAVLNVLNLAELGISGAIVCSMYKPIADGDNSTICALLALYRKVYKIIGSVIFAVGLVVLPFVNLLIKGSVPNDINIYILFLIYLSNTSLSYLMFAYKNSILVANQRNDIVLKIQSFCSVLQSIIQIILVVLFKNYYLYIIMLPVFTIINNLMIAYVTKKKYPEYECHGNVENNILSKFKEQSAGLMIGKISSTIRASIDSIYISMFLGLVKVGMYNNYFYIVTTISGIIQIIETSMVASVGNSIVTESVEKNYNDFKKFTFFLQWIVSVCSICILCLIQPFMKIWVGSRLMFKMPMAVLCASYLLVFNINLIRSVYTQAIGMWWQLRKISIIDIFVNLFLNLVLVYSMGAYGVLLASVIDVVFVSIPWTTYYLFKEYFGIEHFKKYMINMARYIFNAVVTGVFLLILSEYIHISNLYFDFIIKALICLIGSNIIYLIIYRKNIYYKSMVAYIKNRF